MRRPTGLTGNAGAGQGQGQAQGMNQYAPSGPVVMSVGGKPGGLSFDHVLHKLQASGDYHDSNADVILRRSWRGVRRPAASFRPSPRR